jgi:hypothetical protein
MYELVALFSVLELVFSFGTAPVPYASEMAFCLVTTALRMWCPGLGFAALINGFILLTSLEF